MSLLKKQLIKPLLAIVALSVSQLSYADISNTQASNLLHYSAADQDLSQIGDAMAASLKRNRYINALLTEKGTEQLASKAEIDFGPSVFMKNVTQSVQAVLSDSDYRQLAAWYQSPFGKEVTHYEATRGYAPQKTKSQYKQLMAEASPERIQLLEQFDQLTHATDMTVEIADLVMTETWTANAISQHTYDEKSKKLFNAYKDLRLEQAKGSFKQDTQAHSLFTYAKLSDSSLSKYIDFLKSKPARSFIEAANQGVMKAMNIGSKDFGDSMAKIERAINANPAG
ncbi:hypothetical protein L4C34_19450 [Vibrio profundum]|uniref:hypothetical protein n=1 Tax=Vibrio profundum TaxID=2910247 RepID=UPI003D148457